MAAFRVSGLSRSQRSARDERPAGGTRHRAHSAGYFAVAENGLFGAQTYANDLGRLVSPVRALPQQLLVVLVVHDHTSFFIGASGMSNMLRRYFRMWAARHSRQEKRSCLPT